jgi:phage tail-like protein
VIGNSRLEAAIYAQPQHVYLDLDGRLDAQFYFAVHSADGRPLPRDVTVTPEAMWGPPLADGRTITPAEWQDWLEIQPVDPKDKKSSQFTHVVTVSLPVDPVSIPGQYPFRLRLQSKTEPEQTSASLTAVSFTIGRQRRELARLLPHVFQRTFGPGENVLSAYLGAMVALQEPDMTILNSLARTFDPELADDAYIPFLAQWVNMSDLLDEDDSFPGGMQRLRNLILDVIHLAQWRGTRTGLLMFLETATGLTDFQIDESESQPYHVIVSCPQEAVPLRAFVDKIIKREKPAYVTHELRFRIAAGS